MYLKFATTTTIFPRNNPIAIVNDVIADKNVVTKIMNNSTGLQRIELNGFPDVIGKLVITPLHMVGV